MIFLAGNSKQRLYNSIAVSALHLYHIFPNLRFHIKKKKPFSACNHNLLLYNMWLDYLIIIETKVGINCWKQQKWFLVSANLRKYKHAGLLKSRSWKRLDLNEGYFSIPPQRGCWQACLWVTDGMSMSPFGSCAGRATPRPLLRGTGGGLQRCFQIHRLYLKK